MNNNVWHRNKNFHSLWHCRIRGESTKRDENPLKWKFRVFQLFFSSLEWNSFQLQSSFARQLTASTMLPLFRPFQNQIKYFLGWNFIMKQLQKINVRRQRIFHFPFSLSDSAYCVLCDQKSQTRRPERRRFSHLLHVSCGILLIIYGFLN